MRVLALIAAGLVFLLMLGGLACIYLAIWTEGQESWRWGATAFVSIAISVFGALGVTWLLEEL